MEVAIIKYNAGNIRSVDYALRRIGVVPIITAEPELIRKADKVIFPGQGEAHTTMSYLREHHLDELIMSLKQPVLGICIGMQLLCRHPVYPRCAGVAEYRSVGFPGNFRPDNLFHLSRPA